MVGVVCVIFVMSRYIMFSVMMDGVIAYVEFLELVIITKVTLGS